MHMYTMLVKYVSNARLVYGGKKNKKKIHYTSSARGASYSTFLKKTQ